MSQLPPFAAWLRRFTATGCAALVLLLVTLAASPELHERLHGSDLTQDDGCAVVLFASGVLLAVGAVVVAAPTVVWEQRTRAVAVEIFLASPRYLRQPERGPPEC